MKVIENQRWEWRQVVRLGLDRSGFEIMSSAGLLLLALLNF